VDKRTIIAVLLITLLFIAYTMLFRKPKQQEKDVVQKEEEVVEKQEMEKVEEKVEEKVKEKIVELPTAKPDAEKIITVRTNLYEAKFSTAGATLKSMQLLEYPGKEGKPVELIPEGSSPLSLVLFEMENKLNLGEFPTVCEKDSINLNAGLKDSLVFYYTKNNVPFLKKVFVFVPNSYVIGLHLESLNKTPYSIKLAFDSGLASTEKDERDEMAYTSFVTMLGDHFQRMNLKNVKEEKSSIEGTVNWAGVTSKYFLFFILSEDNVIKKVSQWKIEKKFLKGSMGLGPTSNEEAREIWTQVSQKSLHDLLLMFNKLSSKEELPLFPLVEKLVYRMSSLCHPGTSANTNLKCSLCWNYSTMAANLNSILSCIGLRSMHYNKENIVYLFSCSRVDYSSINNPVAFY